MKRKIKLELSEQEFDDLLSVVDIGIEFNPSKEDCPAFTKAIGRLYKKLWKIFKAGEK